MASSTNNIIKATPDNINAKPKSTSRSEKHTSKPGFNDPETKLNMRYLQMMKDPIRNGYEFSQKIIHDNCKGIFDYKFIRKFHRRGLKGISSRRRNKISFHNKRKKSSKTLVFHQGIKNTLHQNISRRNPRPGAKSRINDTYNLSEPSPPITNLFPLHSPRRHGEIDSNPISNSMHLGNSLRMNAPRLHREIDSSLFSNNMSIRNNNLRLKESEISRVLHSFLSSMASFTNNTIKAPPENIRKALRHKTGLFLNCLDCDLGNCKGNHYAFLFDWKWPAKAKYENGRFPLITAIEKGWKWSELQKNFRATHACY